MKRMKETLAELRAACDDRLFTGVLILKLLAGSCLASRYFLEDRFIAFARFFVTSGFQDPWSEFLRRGLPDAFPYSGTMLAAFALPIGAGELLLGWAGPPRWTLLLLARLPLLAADLSIFLTLLRWFPNRSRAVVALYWCSPIVFYISYVHGQTDAIPTALLLLAVAAALRVSPWRAGAWLGAAIGAKFHVAAAVPVLGWFLLKAVHRSERRRVLAAYVAALATVLAVVVGLPAMLSGEGYRVMVLQAKEMTWVYDLALTLPQGGRILITPAVLLGLVLHFFTYERISRDLLVLYLGLIYTALIVLVSPGVGWSLWSVPFLCYFLILQNASAFAPFWSYTAAYLAYFVFFVPRMAAIPLNPAMFGARFNAQDVAFTAMQASLALLTAWMYRSGVRIHGRHPERHRTLALGIGGDSGSGKHTLAEVLGRVVGPENTVRLHGDDYHRWERGHDAWRSFTHLNPRANYLRQPVEHLQQLKSGFSIQRQSYDHSHGRFSEPETVEPKSFVFFEGLHPFISARMRELFDIKIFLDTDEPLRKQWKTLRDAKERSHTAEQVAAEMERREPDSQNYIRPQARFADWVIRYEGAQPESLQVRHTLSSGLVEVEDLVSELTSAGAPDLEVSWSLEPKLEQQALEARGTISADKVAAVARRLAPDLGEWLQGEPRWLADMRGVEQLVFLILLKARLRG
jgi:uridine kinase